MKKNIFIIALLFIIVPVISNAQCKDFTKETAMPLLEDFILSGRYNSIKMAPGEQMLIFKTLNKGITYRFIICGVDELPNNIEFEVLDWDDNILYNNEDDDYSKTWDYKNSKTQRIKIVIKVPDEGDEDAEKGCVTLLTGIKNLEGGGY